MRVTMGVMRPTDRMITVMKSCPVSTPPFTSRPPMGSTQTMVAGMTTMAKVKGMMLERIQPMKAPAAAWASRTKRS